MLQNACEKFEFLVKQLFGKKEVFLHAIVSQLSKKLLVAANNLSNILLPK
jgi:hypothetical protein